ncbi:MAG TPA: NAD(P)-dependent oxidoreductase [Armatimonadota bacterium]|jgi:UDP-glucose 4-epimerase
MNKVLVSGAAGQVGCRIVRQLLAKGYEVKGLILPQDMCASRLQGLELEIVEGNLLNPGVAEAAVADVDGVIHTANLVSPLEGMTDEDWFDNNVRTTFNLTRAAAQRAEALERFVSFSSSGVYPNDSHNVACAYHPVDESHPRRPGDVYSLSKLVGEDIVRSYEQSTGLRVAIIRPSGIMSGTDVLGRWTAEFVGIVLEIGMKAAGSEMYLPEGGTPWEDLAALASSPAQPCAVTDPRGRPWAYQPVDARDVAAGAICALEHPAAVGEAFNIASPEPIVYPDAAQALSEATGLPVLEWQAPVRWVYDLDISKAKAWIGYRPQWGLREMIADALAVQAGESDGMS